MLETISVGDNFELVVIDLGCNILDVANIMSNFFKNIVTNMTLSSKLLFPLRLLK